MSSLYAKYIKEREGAEIIELDEGFLSFQTSGEECFLKDLFILPEFRKEHVGARLVDELEKIGKERGCKIITGVICPAAQGATTAMLGAIKIGFSIHSSGVNQIFITRGIK